MAKNTQPSRQAAPRFNGIERTTETRRRKIFDDALKAAHEIGRAEGLAGLTARRIAKEIGCSVGTLYNVFDSLDALILHLNGATLDALYEMIAAVEITENAEESVKNIFAAYTAFVRGNANLWGVIFDHIWPTDYPVPDWYTGKINRLLEHLARALDPLIATGDERKSFQAAAALWGGLHGIYSLSSAGKLGLVTPETVDELSAVLVRNFVAGLRK